MKNIIFIFIAALLITGCTPPMDKKTEKSIVVLPFTKFSKEEKEEEAIKALIEKEISLFVDRDFAPIHQSTLVHIYRL